MGMAERLAARAVARVAEEERAARAAARGAGEERAVGTAARVVAVGSGGGASDGGWRPRAYACALGQCTARAHEPAHH